MEKLLRAAGVTNTGSGTRAGTVGKRLLLPITVGMIALILIVAGGLYRLITDNFERQAKLEITAAAKLYQYTIINYKDTMSGIVELLSSDSRALSLLLERDGDGLFALYEEAFEKMREACGLTYLLFADETRRVVVRVHDPADQGDIIPRKSFTVAEQDNILVTTLDAGSDGRLSLRVVSPIQPEGRLAGFMEVGTEMEHALAAVAQPEKIDVILALDKRFISEDRIRPGETPTPNAAFWVDPGGDYVMYTNFTGLDKKSADTLLQRNAGVGFDDPDLHSGLSVSGNRYMFSAMPLEDSTGERLGNLFIIYNTTSLRNELLIAAAVMLGAVLAVIAASRLLIARRIRDTDADMVGMRKAIEEGEHIFETVFAESETGFILRLAGSDTVLKANASALAVFGVSRAEDIELSLLAPLSADDPMQLVWQTPLLAIHFVAGSRFFEQTHISAGYSEKLECTALREVTDGVLLQSENRAHIVFLQAIINQLPGWVCIKDRTLRPVQVNTTFKALFDEEIGADGAVRYSEEKLESGMAMLQEADREALRTGEPVTLELKVPGPPGGRGDKTYVVTKQRFTGRDGQAHILSTGTDITERVRMTEQLVVLHQKAEESSQAKTRFLARMSHELRTPINGVVGMSYLALKLAVDGQLRQYVEKIQESSKDLLTLITDILNYAEMEAGEAGLETGRFTLQAELEAVKEQMQPLLRHKPVEFALEACGTDRQFIGDAGRIRQVLLILCDNAAKFTESGTVRLSCSLEETGGKACAARFVVEDTGIGIADEQREHLFDSFHQVDGGTTRRFGGIGLGLAIAGQAVALMGGRLEVESAPGRGSRFSFSIPLACPDGETANVSSETGGAPDILDTPYVPITPDIPDTADTSDTPTNAQQASSDLALPPGRVLVVEDNTLNQMIILELLEHAGLQATAVNNGREAVDIVGVQTFDLVLMDLQMPVMGGVEATELIRALEAGTGERLPIIALTANAQDSDRAECALAGMNDFLSKPIDVDQLYAKLKQWLSEKGA